MAEAWMASLLAFFAGVIVGIYLGKRRWDKNIKEEDCEEPTEQRSSPNVAGSLFRNCTNFSKDKVNMENSKHYPTHPGAEHPPIMTYEIPLEEYESLKRENEELKDEVKRLENVRKIHIESIGSMCEGLKLNAKQICKTQRALWLLKARYFWILMVYASDLSKVANPSIIHKSNILANPTPRCMEEYQHEAGLYDNARIKCLNKAEEYK